MTQSRQPPSKDQGDAMDEQELERILKKVGPRPLPPQEVRQETKSAVYALWREQVETSRRARMTRRLALAASVVIVVTAGLFLLENRVPESIASVDGSMNRVETYTDGSWREFNGESLGRSSRIRTGSDAYLSLSLMNGINVRLDQNTDVSLTDVEMLSLLKGSVYVDSYGFLPDGGFVVNTGFGSANDIGTQFVVTTHEDGWNVQVREGVVVVRDSEITTLVELGERLTISADDVMTTTEVKSDDPSWKWTENVSPLFVIEGKSLNDYLEWMARETGRKIEFQTELARSAAKSTMLHGSIEGLQPGESLGVVLSTTDLKEVDDHSESILIDTSPVN